MTHKGAPASPNPTIQVPGRLSLRSPIRIPPAPGFMMTHGKEPPGWNMNTPRSPAISEIFVRQQDRAWGNGQNHPVQAPVMFYDQPPQLAQPIYNTPEPRGRVSLQQQPMPPPRTAPSMYNRTIRNNMPPSPRPVHRGGGGGGAWNSRELTQNNYSHGSII